MSNARVWLTKWLRLPRCGLCAATIGVDDPYAPVLMLAGLPGLIGGIYHTWRLWP